MMRRLLSLLLLATTATAQAEPSPELVYRLKPSVVRINVATAAGGHGVGSGVAVATDQIATSCHVLANAQGINFNLMGDGHTPVAIKADWKHDVCLLRTSGVTLFPVELGDEQALAYDQETFSIGFPGGVMKPLTTYGAVTGLFKLDDSQVIRTSASFRTGASGSPLMDEKGLLVGINTVKSPGRDAFYYSVPVKWIKALLNAPDAASLIPDAPPFWDAPDAQRPYFMRVVNYQITENWADLAKIASDWTTVEPDSVEAWHILGLAYTKLGETANALTAFHKALALKPQHAATLQEFEKITGTNHTTHE
jgi:tetratricopeptide (TPR) repeat protein